MCDICCAIGLSDKSRVKCKWCRWFWQSRELHRSQPTLVECFPEALWAFCEAQNVSLRSRLYLQCTQSPIQLLLEDWVLAMYTVSWLDSGVKNCNRVGCGQRYWTAVSIAEVSLGVRKVSAFLKAHSSPSVGRYSSLFLSLFCSTHFFSRLLFFFTNEKKETRVTDISKLRSLSISSQQALWSSAAPERGDHGLAVCTGLNQSGSLWAQVHLSQMLIYRAPALRPEALYMYLVQNNMSRHAKPIPPGFFVWGPGKDVTHRGG